MTAQETLDEGQQKLDEHAKMIAEAKARLKEYNETQPRNVNTFMEKRRMIEEIMIAEHGHDYDKPVFVMQVKKAEQDVINKWLESLRPEILAKQRPDPLGGNEPYYGAIGGGVTYSFTGTGLGTILVVTESITGKELNVTAALDWFFFD